LDRLVMVAELDFDNAGKRNGMRFAHAVIHSKARLTYTQVAAALLDNVIDEKTGPLIEDLKLMQKLAELRIKLRH
ncbi:MAG: RNB domain-containing ribonuclease, partial [Phycisphaerae bacterium]|nr:RNB domain-containing ribonuclease [Gammaproteobacteria bacterium]NIR50364.1 RNB domain-containing ribonuclease [candidate division KSB1 bacterium]NIV01583.1 RNB domain-containing ribonuclease [Phycisphaerae bacterium]NIQ12709.1 RNB domain-containing ribonuclease [Gammaproteobacteria bacterium]NIS25813.1 RNB domain-containing ribonuclease [candidate division KSB1 bacterium]